MKSVGGNTEAVLQKENTNKNAFGAKATTYEDVQSLTGWLDYLSGDGSYKTSFKGDVEETTHIFICDYVSIPKGKYRMVIDNQAYDVLLIDDPMGLHYQLEIYLKYSEVVQ